MNFYLIEEYINKMKKEDIEKFALKQGITLNDEELSIIYEYIKNNYKTILYGNPKNILLEIKEKVNYITYSKIENLYMKFKDKIDILQKNIRD